MVISLIDALRSLFSEDSASETPPFLVTKAGCFGSGMSAISLLSIEHTVATLGLSLAASCTHKRPMWTHFRNSFSKTGSKISGSTKPLISPSFQTDQTYKTEKLMRA
ncbi:unnamed protein product [Microthlaspi erraticum]|uniref:Uncharacterized protein n=1 Tax=Microthlaspi erraticum TaxID=1685480 RepID=A0A6D2HXB6_9BRAS|nr:unnamed protein product [Microthlaspi erraticum]